MSRNEKIGLFVAGILFAIVLAVILLLKLIDTAQAIQIIISFVLVLITSIYVKRTADIADATRWQAKATKQQAEATLLQAEASVKMAEEMREQRYDALRPIIDIGNIQRMPIELANQAYAKEPPKGLGCILYNVGVGTAIDVYSFVCLPSGERRRHNFDTIAIGKETSPRMLSLAQKDDHWFLVAYYKDVYGRWFESSREVRIGAVNPDPLQIREITEEELPK